MSGRLVWLLALLALAQPETLVAQTFKTVDLAGTWGRKNSMEVGGGFEFVVFGVPLLAGVGGAVVELGLDEGLEWQEERTRIVDQGGSYVNPEEGRTTPHFHGWLRLEWSPSWFGFSTMLDPREYSGAVGGHVAVPFAVGSEALGEVRWAHGFGYDISVRLRWVR